MKNGMSVSKKLEDYLIKRLLTIISRGTRMCDYIMRANALDELTWGGKLFIQRALGDEHYWGYASVSLGRGFDRFDIVWVYLIDN